MFSVHMVILFAISTEDSSMKIKCFSRSILLYSLLIDIYAKMFMNKQTIEKVHQLIQIYHQFITVNMRTNLAKSLLL